jgi:hypothetical protein
MCSHGLPSHIWSSAGTLPEGIRIRPVASTRPLCPHPGPHGRCPSHQHSRRCNLIGMLGGTYAITSVLVRSKSIGWISSCRAVLRKCLSFVVRCGTATRKCFHCTCSPARMTGEILPPRYAHRLHPVPQERGHDCGPCVSYRLRRRVASTIESLFVRFVSFVVRPRAADHADAC